MQGRGQNKGKPVKQYGCRSSRQPVLQTGPQGTYRRIKRLLFTFMYEHKNLIYYSQVQRDRSVPALHALRVKASSQLPVFWEACCHLMEYLITACSGLLWVYMPVRCTCSLLTPMADFVSSI